MRFSSIGLFAFAVLATPLAVGCTSSSNSDSTLVVENEQSVAMDELYVDNVGDESFSDNLLGNLPLAPGATITIDVVCGNYDVSIHNEDATHCVITDVSLCFNNVDWIINDSTCTFSDRTTGTTKSVPKVPDAAQTTRQ